MNRFLTMFRLELKKVLLVPWVILFGIIFPPFIFVMQMENIKKASGNYFNPLSLIPMLTVLTIVILCLTSLPIGFASDRESKYFKRLRLAGVSPFLYMVVHYTIQLILGAFTMTLLAIIGKFKYDIKIPYEYLPKFFVILLLLHLMLYFIGVVVGNTSSEVKSVQTRALVLYFIVLFLGDLTYPIETMAESIQKISWTLPTTYGVELLRQVLSGSSIMYHNYIFVIIGFLAVAAVGANRLFRWE